MDSDLKLIAKYFAGDEKSLEILILRYLKPIYSFVYRYIGNASDAEDITQEVFVKVWRNLRKFNPKKSRFISLREKQEKSFKTWIFSIAKNTSIDFFRKFQSASGGKKSIPFSSFENEKGENMFIETLADPAPLPEELLEQVDIKKMLDAAMKKLSPPHRLVLFLRYNDHFTFREIAETLGEPLHTVKSRHYRALIKLKKLLFES